MNDLNQIIHSDARHKEVLTQGFISFAFPGVPGVGCLFSTVAAGSMSIAQDMDAETQKLDLKNRQSALQAADVDGWVELLQVHKDDMLHDPEPTPLDAPSSLEADGSCTGRRRVALTIKTADCQPILLTNRTGTAVAALHVGWRGNVVNFPASGLRHFCERYGVQAQDVLAVRGPSLGPGAAEFINFADEWGDAFLPWFDKTSRTMNLWELTRHQLMRAGVPSGNIFGLDLCTHSLPGLFFSHRRGHAGRQVSMIWKR